MNAAALILWVLVGILLLGRAALAQTPLVSSSKETSSSAVSALPPGPTSIGARNAQQYRNLIIPELYVLIRSGAAEIKAYSQLDYTPPRAEIPERIDSLLNASSAEQRESTRLLWAGQSAWWNRKCLDAVVDLSWARDLKLEGHLQARFVRTYTIGASADQYFREVFAVASPDPVSGLSYLTFRSFGSDEDSLWFFSPAIKKTRQLTGSNRSDAILGSTLSLDDLFVWSGKVEMVEVSGARQVRALVPFDALTMRRVERSAAKGSCALVYQEDDGEVGNSALKQSTADAAAPLGRLPFPDTAEVIQAIGGLSELSHASFVPRTLSRIDLLPTDPFSLYARQVIFLDSETHLPFYKLVYDRTGSLWKIAVAVAGYASDGSSDIYPYYSRIIVLDKMSQVMSSMTFRSLSVCNDLPTDIQLNFFDPSKLNGNNFVRVKKEE